MAPIEFTVVWLFSTQEHNNESELPAHGWGVWVRKCGQGRKCDINFLKDVVRKSIYISPKIRMNCIVGRKNFLKVMEGYKYLNEGGNFFPTLG